MKYILYRTKTWDSDAQMWCDEEEILVPIEEPTPEPKIVVTYNGKEL